MVREERLTVDVGIKRHLVEHGWTLLSLNVLSEGCGQMQHVVAHGLWYHWRLTVSQLVEVWQSDESK